MAFLFFSVTGLTGRTESIGKGYRLRPWKDALEGVIRKAKEKKPDLVVLLNSMPGMDYLALSRLFPGIRVVIEAVPHGANTDPVIYGNLIKCEIMPRGKYLARLDLSGDIRAQWQPDLSRKKENLLRRLDSLDWRINRLLRSRRKVRQEYLENLKLQKEKTEAELAEVDERLKKVTDGARFRRTVVAIEPETADDPDVLKAVEKGKQEILALKRELEKNRKRKESEMKKIFKAGYTGWTTCTRCHEKQASSWRTSRHAYAYNTLMDKKSSADLRCLPCHVTGVLTGRESYALFLPGKLRAVGCEACHGPGQKHTADPAGAPMNAAAAKKTCGRCHVPEHDDDFDLNRDVAILNCTGSGR